MNKQKIFADSTETASASLEKNAGLSIQGFAKNSEIRDPRD